MKIFKTMDECRDQFFLDLPREVQKEILWSCYTMEMFNLPQSEVCVMEDGDKELDIEKELEADIVEEHEGYRKSLYVFDDYGNGKTIFRKAF